jgi:hypothetical protein
VLLILDMTANRAKIGLCGKIGGTPKCCRQRKDKKLRNPESLLHKKEG